MLRNGYAQILLLSAILLECKTILSQVLNDYDTETMIFYRWHVTYTQEEISQLIKDKTGIDFGEIIDIIPLLRAERSSVKTRFGRLKASHGDWKGTRNSPYA